MRIFNPCKKRDELVEVRCEHCGKSIAEAKQSGWNIEYEMDFMIDKNVTKLNDGGYVHDGCYDRLRFPHRFK